MSRGSEEVTCGQYALQESSEAKSSHVELARAPSPLPLAEELSIPDGGYGWVNVFAVLLINGFTWGAVTSYGVYLGHYLNHEIFPEATPMDYAFIGGFNFSMAVSIAPLATFLARKYDTHTPMVLGVVCEAAGFIMASFAKRVWHLYLSQGVLVGVGVGLTYIPSMAIISQWFSRKRSLANAISASGSGIWGMVLCFATQAMIDRLGVAWSLRILGIIVFVVLSVATFLVRNRNKYIQPAQRVFDTHLVRRYDVILLLCWSFINMFGYITLTFSLTDFARTIGVEGFRAGAVAAYINLGVFIGRPILGYLSDRFGRIEVAGGCTLLTGVFCFAWWLPTRSYASLVAFSLICSAPWGIFWAAIGALAADVAGVKEVPSVLSLAWIAIILPTTFAEVIALKLRRAEFTNQYLYPQIFSGISFMISSIFMFELWRVVRRREKRSPSTRISQGPDDANI